MAFFDRFQYVPGQAKDHFVRNGTIVLAVFAFVVFFIYSGGKIPFVPAGGRTVTANFATSANVSPGKTPVRVHGVNVGEVSSLKRLPGGRGVQIKMRITDKGVHLMSDARAHIYWRTLLGFAFYIQLDEGSSGTPLSGPIPLDHTTTQVELDQVLQGLTPPSRSGFQQILGQFNEGFNGKTAAGRSLDALGPSMQQIGPGLEALRGQNPGDLTNTIRSASRLTGVLAKHEVDLGDLIDNGNQTLAATAAQRASIGSILDDAPSTLDQTKETVIRLRGTLSKLNPVADDLRPGVKRIVPMSHAVKPALDQLNPTLANLRPTLSDLRPALKRLRSASRAGVPLLKGLDPTFDNLNNTILPGLDVTGETGRKAYEVIGPTIAAVSDSASVYDAYGYVQAFNAVSGGGNSAGFLPCSVSLDKGLTCNDVNKVISGFLGGVPTSSADRSGTKSISSSSSSSGSSTGSASSDSSAAADTTPAPKKTVQDVTDLVQGVL